MRTQMRLLVFASVMALALAAAACDGDGGGDDDGTATPSAEGTFVPTPDSVAYPVTFPDRLGRRVTIDAAPERIAAISPAASAYVYALGRESVTRSSDTEAAEAEAATDIGPAEAPDIEKIRDADPDVIIADAVIQAEFVEELESIGVPVVYTAAPALVEVIQSFDVMGQAIDKRAEAEQAAAALQNQITVIGSRLSGERPPVLIVQGQGSDLQAALPGSFAGDLLRLLGAVNVAAPEESAPDSAAFRPIALDEIARRAPQVIIVLRRGDEPADAQDFARAPELAAVPAIVDGRVHTLLDVPGPRSSDMLDQMSKMIYPSIFGP